MRIVHFLLISTLLLLSCNNIKNSELNVKNSELMEVAVDMGINQRLPLSEITEEMTTIDLELTDECIMNPDQILKILLIDSLVVIAEMERMFVFDREGRFVRSIGSKGRGPGEYIGIRTFTIDEKNKIIYIIDQSTIISYDLNGKFLKQITLSNLHRGQILGLYCFNEELLLLAESVNEGQIESYKRLKCYHSVLYKVNDELQFMDSCFIRNVYFETTFRMGLLKEYLTCNHSDVYFYYPEFFSLGINFIPALQSMGPIKRISRDTLYRFENNQLIPELKLIFKRNGRDYDADKYIGLHEMYRSSRYIFAEYEIGTDRSSHFYYCFDTKTGITYNSKYSREELHEKVIRPIGNDTELFYYWRTHDENELHSKLNPTLTTTPQSLRSHRNDLHNERNPTLYIGRLKQ